MRKTAKILLISLSLVLMLGMFSVLASASGAPFFGAPGKARAADMMDLQVSAEEMKIPGILYNLSLENDMRINLAIPAEYVGDGLVESVTVEGTDTPLRGRFQTLNDKEYYLVTCPAISVLHATEAVRFEIRESTYGMKEVISISPVGYARKLLLETEDAVERELARSILAYILGAERYFDGDAERIAELEAALSGTEAPAEKDSFGESLDTSALSKTALDAACIEFGGSTPAFVILLDKSAPETEIEVSYITGNSAYVKKSFKLSQTNNKARIIGMKISDFDALLTITIGGEDYKYNLVTFFNQFVKQGIFASERAKNKAFANAIWDYVQAANAYKKQAEDVVRYSDFGADTTGKVDAFSAIKAAHEYANANGKRVEADFGASYYIGVHKDEIRVATDTDWKNAKFTIDDSKITRDACSYSVFHVAPTQSEIVLSVSGGKIKSDSASKSLGLAGRRISASKFKPGSTNIGLTFPDTVMLKVENSNKKVYKRTSGGSNNMQDLVVVDKNGNLNENTPFTFDYGEVTKISVYSAYDSPITIEGGVFYTRANLMPSDGYVSVYRDLKIERSNTTVKGVEHYMIDEPTTESASMPYNGFFYVRYANNVTFEDCVVTGHRVYQNTQNGSWNGSYDVNAYNANNVSWINCRQMHLDSNGNPVDQDITYNGYWGVIGTNFSRNLTLVGCRFSRFDAHCGVYNLTVTDSIIGYQTLNFVGHGTATFTRTTVYGGSFISLRGDYGATWNGDIRIKDCVLRMPRNHTYGAIIAAGWTNHDFGYECHLPNVYIDGFTVYAGDEILDGTGKKIGIFYGTKDPEYAKSEGVNNIFKKSGKNINPFILPSRIEINNTVINDIFKDIDSYTTEEKALIDAVPVYRDGVKVSGK